MTTSVDPTATPRPVESACPKYFASRVILLGLVVAAALLQISSLFPAERSPESLERATLHRDIRTKPVDRAESGDVQSSVTSSLVPDSLDASIIRGENNDTVGYRGDEADLRRRLHSVTLRDNGVSLPPLSPFENVVSYCSRLWRRYDSTWLTMSGNMLSAVVAAAHVPGGARKTYIASHPTSSEVFPPLRFETDAHVRGLPLYHAARTLLGISISAPAPPLQNRIRRAESNGSSTTGIRSVLVVPARSATLVPSGVWQQKRAARLAPSTTLTEIVSRRSLPLGICDATMSMWCQLATDRTDRSLPTTLRWRHISNRTVLWEELYWRTNETAIERGGIPLSQAYPAAFPPIVVRENFCLKRGHPASEARPRGRALRKYFDLQETKSFLLRNVAVFRGEIYAKAASNVHPSASAVEQGVRKHTSPGEPSPHHDVRNRTWDDVISTLRHTPEFNVLNGRWPSDTYSERRVLAAHQLAEALEKALPSTPSRRRVKRVGRAVLMPPSDLHGGYHTLADGLINHIHAVRHLLARGENVSVVMRGAVRTALDRAFAPPGSWEAADCTAEGFSKCASRANPSELRYLLLEMAGGADNLHVSYPPGSVGARGGSARDDVDAVYEVDELYVGHPSNCVIIDARMANLYESFEAIMYSRGRLDCDATWWVYRQLVFRLTRRAMERTRTAAKGDRETLLQNRLDRPLKVKMSQRVVLGDRENLSANGVVDVRGSSLLATLDLPSDTFLNLPVNVSAEGIHVVVGFRAVGSSRSFSILEQKQILDRVESALRRRAECRGTAPLLLPARCTLRYGSFTGLRDAALLLSTATVAILPHGFETMNVPLLRPNAILITYDSISPMIVPVVPAWMHWHMFLVDCAPRRGAPNGCREVNHNYVDNGYRVRPSQVRALVKKLVSMLDAQRSGSIVLTYDFLPVRSG